LTYINRKTAISRWLFIITKHKKIDQILPESYRMTKYDKILSDSYWMKHLRKKYDETFFQQMENIKTNWCHIGLPSVLLSEKNGQAIRWTVFNEKCTYLLTYVL